MLMIKRNSGFLRSLISFPWFWDSSKCKISVRVQGFLKKVEVVTSLSMAEKDFTWFIQQGNTSCKSYTICLAQSRNRETQRRNYPREGRLEGVEGEKGRRGRGGWRGRRTYRGRAPCWTCFLHFHLLPPSFYKPPSSNLSSFDTTKHAMRDTRKEAFVVCDTCVQ